MKEELTFNIETPLGEEHKKALEKLANPDEFVLYAENAKKLIPIAYVRRHPDCDRKVFAEIMKKIMIEL